MKATSTQQHETTHQATRSKTVYNTQTEQLRTSINNQQKQKQKCKQNHDVTHQQNQQPKNSKEIENTTEKEREE